MLCVSVHDRNSVMSIWSKIQEYANYTHHAHCSTALNPISQYHHQLFLSFEPTTHEISIDENVSEQTGYDYDIYSRARFESANIERLRRRSLVP